MENFDEKDYKINKLKVDTNFLTFCLNNLQKEIIDLKRGRKAMLYALYARE